MATVTARLPFMHLKQAGCARSPIVDRGVVRAPLSRVTRPSLRPPSAGPASGLHRRLEVVPPATYGVAQCSEQPKNQSNHEDDRSDRPNNGDSREKPDDERSEER